MKVSVRREDKRAVWVVENRYDKVLRQLDLRTFMNRSKADGSLKELSGVIIGEILSRAFPSDIWKDMVLLTSVNGWVEATLRCEVAEESANESK